MFFEELPMILKPKDVQIYLGITKREVYALFNSKGFPSEKINRSHIIPKPRFSRWLDEAKRSGQAI